MTERFIFRASGPGDLAADVVASVQHVTNARILDQTASMLLVEGNEAALRAVAEAHGDVKLFPYIDSAASVPPMRMSIGTGESSS